jgi:hypothetical protein
MEQSAIIPFEGWVRRNFDHPVTDPEWYKENEADVWQDPASMTVTYLTRAFENAEEVFQPYSNEQLAQGLWWLASASEYMFAVLDVSVPWPDQRRCLASMYELFAQCLLPRCQPEHLSHMDFGGVSGPLNTLCYMWWDLLPIYGHTGATPGSQEAETDKICLDVMERILWLGSDACRESALHGLGDWGRYYPEEVTSIIDNFVADNTLSPGLILYVENAKRGSV